MTEMPLVYTVPEAADLLHRSRASVYADIATGRLPAVKWGANSMCVPREALERFLVEEAFRQQAARAIETGTVAPEANMAAQFKTLPRAGRRRRRTTMPSAEAVA